MRSLVINASMLFMLLPPAAAEPFRLTAAEADQVTAGSGFSVPATTLTIQVVLGDQTLVDETLQLPEGGRLVLNARENLVLITENSRRRIASGIRGNDLVLSAGGIDLILEHWEGNDGLVLVRAHGGGTLVFPEHVGFVLATSEDSHSDAHSVVINSSTDSETVVQTATAVATAESGIVARAVAINTFHQ